MTGIAFASLSATIDAQGPVVLLVLKATLILGVAAGVTMLLQRATAGTRHLVWLVAIAALLLVPALSAWAPLRVPVLPARLPAAQATPAPAAPALLADAELAAPPRTPDQAMPERVAESPAAMAASEPPVTSPWRTGLMLVVGAWLLVALVIGLMLARAAFVVRRIVRHATPLTQPEWLDPLYEVADRLELDDAPVLVRSDEVMMPFACGLVRPTIVLPASCERWDLERRQAVLLHELAHIQRRDLVGHTLGRIACAIYWFHPLVWGAARRLRAESERACDDIAIACGARATDYAEHLLDIVSSVKRDRTPAMALAMAQRKEFEGRMLAILDPDIPRVARGRARPLALVAGVAMIGLLVGAAAPAPRAALGAQPPSVGVSEGAEQRTNVQADVEHDVAGIGVSTAIEASAAASAAATADAVAPVVESVVATVVPQTIESVLLGLMGTDTHASDERPALLIRTLGADSSARVRKVAAWALAEYADQAGVVEALARAVRRDADPGVREMAAWALAEGNGRGASNALAEAVRSDASMRVRATAAWALGEVGDESAVPALVAALTTQDDGLRQRALWAIGEIGPSRAPAPVVAMLRADDERTRMLAAWVLYEIEDPATAGPLRDAFRAETNKELRFAYMRALAELGEPSVEVIRELLDSPDERVRSMAVGALSGQSIDGPWPWPWPEPRPTP